MKTLGLLLLVLTTFGVSFESQAIPLKVLYQDVKLPTQRVLERQVLTAPIASNTNYLLNDSTGPTSAAVFTVTTFLHQPDVPRVIQIIPQGTTGDVESCAITISGTNVNGRAITDTITFAADATAMIPGVKAFKTVSSISWAASCESGSFGAKWQVGVGKALGLKRCMDFAGDFGWAEFGGVRESTQPSCVADSDEVEKNVCTLNTALSASNVIFWFPQNNRSECY